MNDAVREGATKLVASAAGSVFLLFGIFAMVSPSGFYETVARFEPYNAHFVQDIGAFQIGLGAVLLFGALLTSDALAATTLGVGVGSVAHLISHLAGLDAGGTPLVDVPFFTLLGAVLLVTGWRRLRAVNGR
jgi:hypothetical protein